MNEENENQPVPLPTESAMPEQRQHRPRRRFPRRRYRDRGDRFGGDDSKESPNSSAREADPAGACRREIETGFGGREIAEGVSRKRRTKFRPSRNSAKASSKFPGKGFGFLRDPKRNFVQTPQDIFVTPEIVRRFALRDGMWIYGETRRGNRGPQLVKLLKINGEEPPKYQGLRPFEELTTINPNKRIKLETVPDRYTTRIMDLMTPLGMGQRGLIVAPPRTGKTTLLHHIAEAVAKNHPEMKSDHSPGR